MVSRQQVKPEGRVFLTATSTGDHLICFQNLPNYQAGVAYQQHVNSYAKLALEVFLGDSGDPNIVAPINAKLNDLTYHLAKVNELIADVRREQDLQRDREDSFRSLSHSINSRTCWFPVAQLFLILGTAAWQMMHMSKFFKAKKLV